MAGSAEKPTERGELPEAYGTKRLHLTARDPHWLYAHWDLTQEQRKHYNSLSAERHLTLRLYKNADREKPCNEIHVHPESRNWFINVDEGGAKYLSELGYYSRQTGRWVTISTSAETVTPPDRPSEDVSVWFETLPPELQFDHLLQLIKKSLPEHPPLMETLQQLRASGFPGLPGGEAITAGNWTSEQERALAELISMDSVRRLWIGSLEITELYSAAAARFSVPGSGSGAVSSFSSPMGGKEREKAFWFNINAELILYGATEPDAQVTIGGRVIRLSPAGTFNYRLSLPDGQYQLPVVAASADGTESRRAELTFSRSSQYSGSGNDQ